MAIEKITIEKFLQLQESIPVLDVRSPGEYRQAHIPGAYSLPLFTDEERKVVGTAYKQQSRQQAIKIGLDYFGVKMRKMVEEVEQLMAGKKTLTEQSGNGQKITNSVIVHCWRGGMRSAGVAWLLDLYGYKVYTIIGGYKSFRQWARSQFDKEHSLKVIGGYTGSGKSVLLKYLQQKGKAIIDLETIASHKGSAFGALGEAAQPSQEMFENTLAVHLAKTNNNNPVFIEDESQRIGNLIIPNPFWKQMRTADLFFFDIPFEARLTNLVDLYGTYNNAELEAGIYRVQKRLGGLETKNAIKFLYENNHRECFRILLHYYDKQYNKGLQARKEAGSSIKKCICAATDIETMTNTLINENEIFF